MGAIGRRGVYRDLKFAPVIYLLAPVTNAKRSQSALIYVSMSATAMRSAP